MSEVHAPSTVCVKTRERGPYKWTDERIEQELQALLASNGGRLPSARDLERHGLAGLRGAMRHRGVPYWAQRLGLDLRPGQDRRPYSEQQAIDDMRRAVQQQQAAVGLVRLRALGFPRLASYLARHRWSSADFCARHNISAY